MKTRCIIITIPPKADKSQRKINSVIIPVCLTNINTHQIDCSYAYVYAIYACAVSNILFTLLCVCDIVIFSISIRLLCLYGYGKYGNRGSNKSLQFYTFRLIKQWQYQNKRQSFNIFTTLGYDDARIKIPNLFENISVYTQYTHTHGKPTDNSYIISYDSKTKTLPYIFDGDGSWRASCAKMCVHSTWHNRSMNCDAQPF